MSKDKKQTIKCDVDSCKYNNTDNKKCALDEIKVSCICDNDDCRSSDETICDSFEERDIDYDEEDFEEELVDDIDDFDEDDDEEENYDEDEDEFEIEEYVEVEERIEEE